VIPSIARIMFGGGVLLGAVGCAGTYDLVTSQRFKDRPFETMFSSEDPVIVLETIEEGDDRVRAMRKLEEPKTSGRPGEQEKIMAILQTSAISDKRALCRLGAIEALARFEDPRSAGILIAAYDSATSDGSGPKPGVVAAGGMSSKQQVSSFTPDTVTTIRCRVLEGLSKHRTPEALNLLCQVASTPSEPMATPKKEIEQVGFDISLTSESDRVDIRLAAIRSLGNYQGDARAAKTLISIMQKEKDVAIRGRAHESLTKITGQDFDADSKEWEKWLNQGAKMKSPGLF
jgi:HEAT repeat protein